MTQETDTNDRQPNVLKQEIMNQSVQEAAAILKQARTDAERTLESAEKEAGRIREEYLRKAEMQAEAVKRKILSGLHLEIQQEELKSREALLNEVFDRVKARLERFRGKKDYRAVLERFIVEGAQALGGKTVRIVAGSEEKKRLTQAVISAIEKAAAVEGEGKITLKLEKQTADEGGVLLESEDGRIRYDNRFSSRLERFKRRMRLEATKRILGN